MEYFYAQLDSQGNCIALSSLSGEVIAPNMVRLTTEEYLYGDLLTRKYLGSGTWSDKPEPEPLSVFDLGQGDLSSRVETLEKSIGIITGEADNELN